MDLRLDGKRALVTGSTAGLGEAIATFLAAEGAVVVVHGRNEARARAVEEAIRASGGRVDIVLGESVYGTYDFAAKTYHGVPETEYRQQVALLTRLRSIKPSLWICTLDYWDPGDREGIRRLYREERSHGFDPYVATISLDRLVREPQ